MYVEEPEITTKPLHTLLPLLRNILLKNKAYTAKPIE